MNLPAHFFITKSVEMKPLQKTGRLFYGAGIIAYGLQQLVILDFRPQIISLFPEWVHQYSIFPIVTGIAMIMAGAVIAGLVRLKVFPPEKISLLLGFYFLTLILTCQIPYLLFVYPHKLSHLGSWGDLLKELAFCGGAFVLYGDYYSDRSAHSQQSAPANIHEWLIPLGRLFFCTTMILFGCCHFAYTNSISMLVPAWFGMPVFWTYFGGIALIGAGTAIALKLFLKTVALLLAVMLFLWFLFLHVPGAIANPSAGRGNAIVSAFDALLFCGVALVLSQTQKPVRNKAAAPTRPEGTKERSRLQVE